MKTKSILTLLLIVTACCFSSNVWAQEKLNALMKRCESMDNVDISVVQQRNPTTRKISQIITTAKFSNNKALVDEFLSAFESDKNDAIQIIDKKKDGRMVPSYYQFNVGSKSVAYTITVKNDGTDASVTMIQNGE